MFSAFSFKELHLLPHSSSQYVSGCALKTIFPYGLITSIRIKKFFHQFFVYQRRRPGIITVRQKTSRSMVLKLSNVWSLIKANVHL